MFLLDLGIFQVENIHFNLDKKICMKNKINSLYRLLLSAYSISMFSEWVLLPIYAVFVQNIGGDVLDASWAMAVFLISQGAFTIIMQRLKRTYKHHITMMIIWWAIWLIGIALYLAVSSTRMLFITQVFIAMGNAWHQVKVEISCRQTHL